MEQNGEQLPPRFSPDNSPWAKHRRVGIRLVPPPEKPHEYRIPDVKEIGSAVVHINFKKEPPEDIVA